MSEKKDGGPAFPETRKSYVGIGMFSDAVTQYETVHGMTLRDYFAGQAIHPLTANYCRNIPNDVSNLSRWAYQIADAMLAERDK